jgi:hypothetical protein
MLRATQSHLLLSRWRESLTVKLQSLQNTDRPMMPKIEIIRRSVSAWLRQRISKSTVHGFLGAGFRASSLQAFTTCVNAGN